MSKRIDIGGGRVWAKTTDGSWADMDDFAHRHVAPDDAYIRASAGSCGLRFLTAAEVERAERGLGPHIDRPIADMSGRDIEAELREIAHGFDMAPPDVDAWIGRLAAGDFPLGMGGRPLALAQEHARIAHVIAGQQFEAAKRRAERGLGPLIAQSVTVRDASSEVIYREPDEVPGITYTCAQLAERKAGAVAAAYALSWGTPAEADRAGARAIAEDAPHALRHLVFADHYSRQLSADHIAGAAQFFRELGEALDGVAASMQAADLPARVERTLADVPLTADDVHEFARETGVDVEFLARRIRERVESSRLCGTPDCSWVNVATIALTCPACGLPTAARKVFQ